jgi:hypothetical protein
MSHFLNHSLIFDLPVRLTQAEMNNPYKFVKEYFDDYSLSEVRNTLWQMVEVCLTTDNANFQDGEARADLINAYEVTEKLLEAVFVISRQE